MSTLSKKLFISVLTLIVTVGAFAATTFAWFTLGNTATVGKFEGSATAGEGLEVRIGESGAWTNFISDTQIQGAINTSSFKNFSAITSKDGKTFTKLLVENNVVTTKPVEDKTDYIEFQLQFRSVTGGSVHLSGVTFASAAASAWLNDGNPFNDALKQPIGGVDSTDRTVVEYISNAARLSVTGETDTVIVEQTAGTNSNVIGMGEISFGAHSFFKSRFDSTVGSQYDAAYAAAALNLSTTLQAGNINSTTRPETKVATLSTGTTKFGETQYHTVTVTVRVWLEGWDANTYNALFNMVLQTSLAFKKGVDIPSD
ncbi:hypothetical protein [Acholeplasma laidlawii]|uniref:hypothetical protein n=1 Tax=Acholeplasma laidlawii TaxID=2148 RepID=UPI00253FBD72|nr:hypothetical protein QOL21_06155 [Acholeplasma laidlawii]